MRRILVPALVGVALVFGAAPAAQAQTPGFDPCDPAARAPARASLGQASMFSPQGYGPWGWAPIMQPWGPDPWGAAVAFGPPGPLATYGPLGPGLTASAIAAFATANGGTLTDSQRIDLASQQQSELSTLLGRYTLGGELQFAGGAWMGGLASRASTTRTILTRMCQAQRLREAAAAAAAAAAPSSEAPPGPQP
jgi:hypothetical protein